MHRLALGLAAWTWLLPAHAESGDWRLSGYATLGHTELRSDTGRTFARDLTQSQPRGWEVDSRVGLQLDGALSSSLGVTAQAVLRPHRAGVPTAQSLEWAFLHWSPQPEWRLRLGRTSPDLFLYADVRSVGIAYPWVRLSQEFYAWMPLQSVDGIDLTRSWTQGDASWRLKLGFGHGQARVFAQDSGTPGDAHIDAVRLLTLTRETPTQRLKFSYMRTTVDLGRAPVLVTLDRSLRQLIGQTQPLLPTLAAEAERLRLGLSLRSRSQYLALGGQQDFGDWQLTGEWSRTWGDARQANGQRHYLSLARRFDTLTPFAVIGRSRMLDPKLPAPLGWQAQLAPLVGPALAAQATALGVGATRAGNLGRGDQRSVGVGLRWDFMPTLALKGQWDRVSVSGDGRSLWSLEPGADGSQAFRGQVFSLSLDASF
jgi:hypothetical protein